MTSEAKTTSIADSEFIIEVSGFLLFLKRFFQVGAIWVLVASVVESFQERNFLHIITGIISCCIYLAVAKYAIRTFPRKVSLEGESIVFHKVPTTWLNINGIPIPLGITQRVVRPKSAVVLEWIGRALTLNDMNNGKSIRLAAGKHADRLAEWFKSTGVGNPVGG
ncbi:hypothetical protein [Geothrix campi]|jgi:hypothetical protein|uniref:hypothetical protein n=1 Tax=Geothrix campi TaxID=2966450 RepID=UPI0021478A87|nr:hypothetical protein [Geothrix sp. SG10]